MYLLNAMLTLCHFGSLLGHVVAYRVGETHGIISHVYHPLLDTLIRYSHTSHFTHSRKRKGEEKKEEEEERKRRKRRELRDFFKAIQDFINREEEVRYPHVFLTLFTLHIYTLFVADCLV